MIVPIYQGTIEPKEIGFFRLKFLSKYTVALLTIFFLVGFSGDNAQAYIDPASGSYIFQLLVAGLLGALFTLKIYWKSFKAFLGNLFRKNKELGDDPKK